MDIDHIIGDLNDEQRHAVTTESSALLVLAGAGSGKTLVLVHRIAWLIQVVGINPFAVLAVTFTNKAAQEMRHRIGDILQQPTSGLWVGTFHSIAQRLLRRHWQEAGLKQDFQILDSEDQLRLIKRIIRELELDDKKWSPKQSQWYINNCKEEGLRPQHIDIQGDLFAQVQQRIYQEYQNACETLGLVDFSELLLRSHELWLTQPDVLGHYQQRFKHILVDEFQDTNTIQYAWLRMLAGSDNDFTVVGDDDQSIYGWRGAKIENIQTFENNFSEHHQKTQVVRLEQNYRSTANILTAANAVIANNSDRLGKNLWTEDSKGDPIYLFNAYNEIDESKFIADKAQDLHNQGLNYSEMAVLYRSNAQSRVIEESLIRKQIPYRIYGGMRFFERAEIKNAIAYIQLLKNPDADSAFERIVNFPTRGIGEQALGKVRMLARTECIPLFSALRKMLAKDAAGRAAKALAAFDQLMNELKDLISDPEIEDNLEKIFDNVIKHSGLMEHYQNDRSEKGKARVENLQELVVAAKQFDTYIEENQDFAPENPSSDTQTSLIAFLDHAALESGNNQADEFEDAMQLMTLHSAKGLEFNTVFIGGMEEQLFPSKMSFEEAGGLAEERRLCYVGITRARKNLYLSYAEMRRLYGEESRRVPSRFIQEIPKEVTHIIRLVNNSYGSNTSYSRSNSSYRSVDSAEGESTLTLGDFVEHPKFGTGTIINAEGRGAHARIQINFDEYGSKWLVMQYANLVKLS